MVVNEHRRLACTVFALVPPPIVPLSRLRSEVMSVFKLFADLAASWARDSGAYGDASALLFLLVLLAHVETSPVRVDRGSIVPFTLLSN